jgi:hypothetical protein
VDVLLHLLHLILKVLFPFGRDNPYKEKTQSRSNHPGSSIISEPGYLLVLRILAKNMTAKNKRKSYCHSPVGVRPKSIHKKSR